MEGDKGDIEGDKGYIEGDKNDSLCKFSGTPQDSTQDYDGYNGLTSTVGDETKSNDDSCKFLVGRGPKLKSVIHGHIVSMNNDIHKEYLWKKT